ncbi:MAG: deoxyribonuclease IV, partial [Solobacterium sp.]|nr:deoxyribonuclease IV [Solobacterium sp.]
PSVSELAVEFLQDELLRVKEIGARYLVLHPGSYTTSDLETGIATIQKQLNRVEVPEGIIICLETMAGKGSECGFRFEQLAQILAGLRQQERYGVCFDTCHTNDAGYDLRNYDSVLDEFDSIIGLKHMHVIHLNDSKNPMGARKDRHANIGTGTLGFELLHAIAADERTAHIAKILETPYIDGKPPYKREIAMLRSGEYSENDH